MTVREDGPPSLRFGGHHGLTIAHLGVLGIEPIRMACDVC
jgi:hypothetical protein